MFNLIAAVILDTLMTEDYNFQDISIYGLNTLNVFYRENQHNPEIQRMVFNMVMRMMKLYFIEDTDKKVDNQYDLNYKNKKLV